VNSLGETRDLRRCVTSPPNNGVARKLAVNNGKPATLDAASVLRGNDILSSVRVRCLRQVSSESDAQTADTTRTIMFIKNNRVMFHLGHDDEVHDVITHDVIASV